MGGGRVNVRSPLSQCDGTLAAVPASSRRGPTHRSDPRRRAWT